VGTKTFEQVSYSRIGDRYRIRYRLGWNIGSSGSGDYLIQLPTGLTFNTGASYNPLFTSFFIPNTVSPFAPYFIPVTGGVIQSSTWSSAAYVMPYSSTQFRLVVFVGNNIIDTWNVNNYSLGTEGILQLEFEIWS
jgi:hypothetical protein